MTARPRIALIHATPIAIDPIRAAFGAAWPEAETVNILEDSLSPDRASAGEISEPLVDRILALARYAAQIGSDGVLFTCSAFGGAIERAARLCAVPVLKPNEAMFEAAVTYGASIGMIATFPPARKSMEEEFQAEAERLRPGAVLTTVVVEPAILALRSGDVEAHNRLVAEAAWALPPVDAVMLAHFSTARAAAAARAATAVPILTSPDAAVLKMRRLVEGGEKASAA